MEGSVVPVSCQTSQQKSGAKDFFLPMVVLAAFFLSSSPVTYSMELLEDAGSRVVPTVYILVVTQESHGLLVTLPIPFLQGPLGDI